METGGRIVSQLTLEPRDARGAVTEPRRSEYARWRWYILPLLLLFAVDFLSPQLIVWGVLPRAVLWLSDLAIGFMAVVAIMRMLIKDHIPKVFLLVMALALIGTIVALFEGQGLTVTMYGMRRMFQYPMVGLYVYMMPQWPPRSAQWIARATLFALAFNTLVQIGMFATGARINDSLAGMFGRHGVGPLIMFTMIVVSFGFGILLARDDWRYLASALALGVLASSLGQMKLFPAAVLLLAVFAFLVQLARERLVRKMIVTIVLLVAGVLGFGYVYNTLVADINEKQIQYYFDLDVLDDYFGGVNSVGDGQYKLSRNSGPLYIWQRNAQSTASFLFGRGIGSAAQSATLGLEGGWHDSSYYAGPGRTLSVLLQETGAVGILTFALFCLAIIATLFKRAGANERSYLAALQLGLLLYTAAWPLWIWYQPIWLQAVPMLLYWSILGYALNEANNLAAREAHAVD